MGKSLSIIIVVLVSGFVPFQSSAKIMSKEEQKESDTAIVTLKNGTVINGVVKKYWTDNYDSQYNSEFTFTNDNGCDINVTTADLDSIVFPLVTDSRFKVWRVYNFPAIKLFGKKGTLERWIAADYKHSDHAQVVMTVVRVNIMRPSTSFIKGGSYWIKATQGCLKLKNDSIAYPFYFEYDTGLNLKFLKKTLGKNQPELVDHIEKWFKADKNRKRRLEKNYDVILEAVEDYYNKKQ